MAPLRLRVRALRGDFQEISVGALLRGLCKSFCAQNTSGRFGKDARSVPLAGNVSHKSYSKGLRRFCFVSVPCTGLVEGIGSPQGAPDRKMIRYVLMKGWRARKRRPFESQGVKIAVTAKGAFVIVFDVEFSKTQSQIFWEFRCVGRFLNSNQYITN